MSTFVEKIRAMREQGRIEENPRPSGYYFGIPETPITNVQSKTFSVDFQKDIMGNRVSLEQRKIPQTLPRQDFGYLSQSRSHIPASVQQRVETVRPGRGDRPRSQLIPSTPVRVETAYSLKKRGDSHYSASYIPLVQKKTELPNFAVRFG